MLEFEMKPFEALSAVELYQVLQLRSAVFVVEQNCIYQDIDGKDGKALHLFGRFEGKVVAYARLFDAGDYFEHASIGRVVVDLDHREKKWGHDLMRAAILGIKQHFGGGTIEISAQQYLEQFYQSHGFQTVSAMYLEDDIPHVRMRRNA